MCPSMTSEFIFHFMEILRLYNVNILKNFHQNWFINERARNNFVTIP